MFSPKLSKITRFCFIEIKFFLGQGPQPPPPPPPAFIVSKRTNVTQDFLIHAIPTPTRTELPFANEKVVPDVSIKNENIVPLNIHRIPLGHFFFCFPMSDPLF